VTTIHLLTEMIPPKDCLTRAGFDVSLTGRPRSRARHFRRPWPFTLCPENMDLIGDSVRPILRYHVCFAKNEAWKPGIFFQPWHRRPADPPTRRPSPTCVAAIAGREDPPGGRILHATKKCLIPNAFHIISRFGITSADTPRRRLLWHDG
jgi:hypothetical protein